MLLGRPKAALLYKVWFYGMAIKNRCSGNTYFLIVASPFGDSQRRFYFNSFSAASFFAIISCCVASFVRSAFTTASGAALTNFCTFASLKYKMLGSVISMQAWLRLSPYAFVVRELLQLFQCRFIFGNNILLCSQLYSFSVDYRLGSS